MRILFIDHMPFVGGAELALVRHIEHLDKRQFGVVVACPGTVPGLVDKLRNAGARVFVVPFEQLKVFSPAVVWRFFKSFRGIWGVLRKERVDLVVTNTERAMYVGTLAAVLARKKLIWWVRDFEYNRFLFRLLSRFPQKIICVSEAIRSYYGGRDSHKFEVVYVGSDFDQKLKNVSLADVLRVKRELGIGEGDFVVGFVGRLVRWKGPQVLVEAAKKFKVQSSKFKIIVVGTGEGQKGNIEHKLHQNHVTLTGHREDVPVLMKVFDVFCHTSTEPEPFATAVVEAMLAGLPVIGTNIGGTPEIIKDGQTGFLVPPNDPEALAKTLLRLAQDSGLRGQIGQAAKNLAMKRNTETVVTREVENIYSLFSNRYAVVGEIKNE